MAYGAWLARACGKTLAFVRMAGGALENYVRQSRFIALSEMGLASASVLGYPKRDQGVRVSGSV